MTERKSTEIKIRVTPSFKARVQSAADAAGVSLTEYLEQASEGRMTAEANWQAADLWKEDVPMPRWTSDSHPAKSASWLDSLEGKHYRRKEPCPHSKPPYAFCPTCDR